MSDIGFVICHWNIRELIIGSETDIYIVDDADDAAAADDDNEHSNDDDDARRPASVVRHPSPIAHILSMVQFQSGNSHMTMTDYAPLFEHTTIQTRAHPYMK